MSTVLRLSGRAFPNLWGYLNCYGQAAGLTFFALRISIGSDRDNGPLRRTRDFSRVLRL